MKHCISDLGRHFVTEQNEGNKPKFARKYTLISYMTKKAVMCTASDAYHKEEAGSRQFHVPPRSLIWLLMPQAFVMCIQEASKRASGSSKFHEAWLLPAGLQQWSGESVPPAAEYWLLQWVPAHHLQDWLSYKMRCQSRSQGAQKQHVLKTTTRLV